MDPRTQARTVMRQDAILKFRLTAAEKEKIASAAHQARTTLSGLARRAVCDAAAGRLVEPKALTDIVTIRRIANSLSTSIDSNGNIPTEVANLVRAAASDLRRIAARNLTMARS